MATAVRQVAETIMWPAAQHPKSVMSAGKNANQLNKINDKMKTREDSATVWGGSEQFESLHSGA